MRRLYSCVFIVLLPLIFFRLWWRGRKAPAYRKRWGERLGYIETTINSQKRKPCLWIHTVSVGEFIAAKPLIEHYLKEDKWQLFLTCMTPTGSEQIQKTYGSNVLHSYAPYDINACIRRFIKSAKPSAYLIMETELWPNTIAQCKKHEIPSILLNARLSEKSAKGYAKFSSISKELLSNLSLVLTQYESDAQRFIQLGIDKNKCYSCGNIKFDLTIDDAHRDKAKLLRTWLDPKNENTIFIAASTHRGEDEIILDAFQRLKETNLNVKLILVPRHPERFQDVFDLCQKFGFSTLKRSELLTRENSGTSIDILLGDTMGELLALIGASDCAFIGGSFINNGGHNYIEAAAWQIPVLSGPSRYNFSDVSEELIREGGLHIVHNAQELIEQWQTLYSDKALRSKRGKNAKAVADSNRGTLTRWLKHLSINS